MTPGATSVKGKLEFNEPARAGIDRYSSSAKGVSAWIQYRAKSKKGNVPFDGAKLYFSLNDEGGKRRDENILELHRILLQSMRIDGKLGKMLYPSTNEDLEDSPNADKYEALWDQSDPSLQYKLDTMSTTSKLWRYFTPAYDGFEMQWFGPFGESIVHAPTKEQREFLIAQGYEDFAPFWDRGWGAFECCSAERDNAPDVLGTKRLIPFTPEDSFRPSNPRGRFQAAKLNGVLGALEMQVPGKSHTVYSHLTVCGRLEWENRKMMGDVVFVPDPAGPFVMNKAYLPGNERAKKLGINANNVVRDRLGVKNGTGQSIIIAFDPTKMDAEDASGHKGQLSWAAGHGFIPYDRMVDQGEWDESDPDFAREYISHAFVFEYYNQLPNVKPMNMDMLKAAIFFNAKFHSEKQVAGAIQLFKDSGASRMLFYSAELNGYNRQSGKVVAGQAATVITENQANNRIAEYLDFFTYPDRMPFPRTIAQLLKYDGTNATKLDLKVSFGFTLMAVQPRELTSAEKHAIQSRSQAAKYKDITDYTRSMCRLY
jgi:hypothetical protein